MVFIEFIYKLSRKMMEYKGKSKGELAMKMYKKIAVASIMFLSVGILTVSTNIVYGNHDKDLKNDYK